VPGQAHQQRRRRQARRRHRRPRSGRRRSGGWSGPQVGLHRYHLTQRAATGPSIGCPARISQPGPGAGKQLPDVKSKVKIQNMILSSYCHIVITISNLYILSGIVNIDSTILSEIGPIGLSTQAGISDSDTAAVTVAAVHSNCFNLKSNNLNTVTITVTGPWPRPASESGTNALRNYENSVTD
jgi:hypothetical protein